MTTSIVVRRVVMRVLQTIRSSLQSDGEFVNFFSSAQGLAR